MYVILDDSTSMNANVHFKHTFFRLLAVPVCVENSEGSGIQHGMRFK